MSSKSCKSLLKDYCSNCTFAGVRFIADETKHWLERILWLGLVALSWYGSGLLVIAAWDDFVSSPISFGVETTYTEWNTEMPAVAVCETANNKKLYEVSDNLWTPEHLIDLEDVLEEIVYFRGQSYHLIDLCYNDDPNENCPTTNFTYLANLVRSDCPQLLTNCSYNWKPFDCCEYFQPIDTDIGKCFIINSVQTPVLKHYPMVSNMTNKRGRLRFDTLLHSMMYTLGKEEVPSLTTSNFYTLKLVIGQKYTRYLAVKNIENDPLLIQNTPKQRSCLFPEENEHGPYPYYSYSACTVRCRKDAQLQLCGCSDHFMLGTSEENRCNLTGLACLHQHSMHLTTLKPRWANRQGLYCDCLPSCNETDITVVRDVHTPNRRNRKRAYVEVILSHLPTERYKRAVVRSQLDLVVSVGGTIGLFVGASLLSFVELFFYVTVRCVNNNIVMEKKRRRNIKKSMRNLHTKLTEEYQNPMILYETKL